MNFNIQLREINWVRLLLFYGTVLVGTYFARKLPNVLNLLLTEITDIPFSFNYNHGCVTLLLALLFYSFSSEGREITLLGTHKARSLLFPLVLFVSYSAYGIENPHGVNKHVWAFVFCGFAFVYNLMEEYAWRGYLLESLGKTSYVLKSLISGVLWSVWHLLVFRNFDQYGGFWIFLVFCIVFSFILTFSVIRTRSIVVAAAIHAFIIQINVAALICFILFMLLLLTWNKGSKQK